MSSLSARCLTGENGGSNLENKKKWVLHFFAGGFFFTGEADGGRRDGAAATAGLQLGLPRRDVLGGRRRRIATPARPFENDPRLGDGLFPVRRAHRHHGTVRRRQEHPHEHPGRLQVLNSGRGT